jgi:hypothetical protein
VKDVFLQDTTQKKDIEKAGVVECETRESVLCESVLFELDTFFWQISFFLFFQDGKMSKISNVTEKHTNTMDVKISFSYTDVTNAMTSRELAEMSVQSLRDFLQHVYKEETAAIRDLSLLAPFFFKTKFQAASEKLNREIAQRTDPLFEDIEISMEASERANGFQLYRANGHMMTFDLYEELMLLSTPTKSWTFDDFKEAMEHVCCSDWYKMDAHGEPYGGFWQFPEGSFERKNAWKLSWEENCKAMYALPFSKDALLKTVQVGCASRLESVRYSNFLCTWVERKAHKMREWYEYVKSLLNECLGHELGRLVIEHFIPAKYDVR